MTKQSPIYSPAHYRMKILTRSNAFQSQLKQLYEAWKSHGVPVPTNGFKRVKDYYAWMEDLRTACNRAMESQEAADAMKKIDKDSSLSATDKVWRRLEAQELCLPPTPHGAVDRLLKAGGLDPKNKPYHLFVTKYVFFGQQEFTDPYFHIERKRDEQTGDMGLYLKLEPHTKREHIVAFWGWIGNELQRLPGYVGKNKRWEEFERDFEIYETYQALKSKTKGGRADYPGLDVAAWQRLRENNKERYAELTLSQVRKSVAKVVAALDDRTT